MPTRICVDCGALCRGTRCDGCRVTSGRGAVRQPGLWPDPRGTSRWADLRLRLFPTADACALCGGGFPEGATGRTRWARSLDHIVPVSRGGDWYDETNLRVTHYGCNSSRGARQAS
jgi:5-methylcytosine-specific restriction endonuclease McrA